MPGWHSLLRKQHSLVNKHPLARAGWGGGDSDRSPPQPRAAGPAGVSERGAGGTDAVPGGG